MISQFHTLFHFSQLPPEEAEFLARYCDLPGDHIDIGTYYGGSACMAALAKRGRGTVYSIDPQQYTKRERMHKFLEEHPEASGVILLSARSEDLDDWFEKSKATTAFIDGDHLPSAVEHDYKALSGIKSIVYIVFHDYDHQAVRDVVQRAVDDGWDLEIGPTLKDHPRPNICTIKRRA